MLYYRYEYERTIDNDWNDDHYFFGVVWCDLEHDVREGDLVTLSAYAMQSEPMWRLRNMVWKDKKPLIGLVVRVKENPHKRNWTSKNESAFYYVNWMQPYGPASRYGNTQGYFFRNDLKFVK